MGETREMGAGASNIKVTTNDNSEKNPDKPGSTNQRVGSSQSPLPRSPETWGELVIKVTIVQRVA